jgi:uncharacterized membrane protein
MKKKPNGLERMLSFSVAFTISLLIWRIIFSGNLTYGFYPLNLFLATVPFLLSNQLKKHEKITWKTILLIAGWLLFFPNAPYLITDIFHFTQRAPVPAWFDLLIVISGAWNGLILAIASLLQVENFLSKKLKPFWVSSITLFIMLLSSCGVYIGRFLRFNSWDIITQPFLLFKTSEKHILFPFDYLQLWAFTFSFALMLSLVYFTIKKLPVYMFGNK